MAGLLRSALAALILLLPSGLFSQHQFRVAVISRELIMKDSVVKQCHASTLAETKDGRIIAAWFGGSYEGAGDVCIWSSVLEKGGWSKPVRMECGRNEQGPLPCWNPVLFRPSDSLLYLFYKQGPNPREWTGMMTCSTDDGLSWSVPARLEQRTGPSKNKPVVTPAGTWLSPSGRETGSRWQAFIERSADRGRTWELIPVDTASGVKVIQPALLPAGGKNILALLRSDQNRIMESSSSDDGKTWGPLTPTNLPNPNSGIDAIVLKPGIFLVVYNPLNGGSEWWKGRNRLSLAVKETDRDWTEIFRLEDHDEGEFSYPSVIQSAGGIIHITYTWNRSNICHVALRIEE